MALCSYACKPFARARYSLSLFTFIYSEIFKSSCCSYACKSFTKGKYRLSLCHFRLLFTLRRWNFLRKFPLQLLPKKSIHFRSFSLLAFSIELLITLDLALATKFSTVRKHGLFSNCFRVGPSISNLKSFRV